MLAIRPKTYRLPFVLRPWRVQCFFDEADTLLGARLSSVTQGIDNEINAMRSTLLIELERFDGVVLFATNFAKIMTMLLLVGFVITSNLSFLISNAAASFGSACWCQVFPWKNKENG